RFRAGPLRGANQLAGQHIDDRFFIAGSEIRQRQVVSIQRWTVLREDLASYLWSIIWQSIPIDLTQQTGLKSTKAEVERIAKLRAREGECSRISTLAGLLDCGPAGIAQAQ